MPGAQEETAMNLSPQSFDGQEQAAPPRMAATDREPLPHMISVWRMADDEQIEDLLRDPAQIEALLDEEGPELDLDRAWHGLHYLLAGTARETAGPRGYILGGRRLGEVNVGYGPARVLSAAEAAIFDDLLQCLPAADFRERFDAGALIRADIYPNLWERDLTGEEDLRAYLCEHFAQLKQFVAAARRDGMGLITYLA
jgi:hypothetical protein